MAAALFLACLIPLLLIHHPNTGWNVNTRLNLIYAVVDEGTLRIDNYHALPAYETGDKAVFEGHFYSDKIFGVSLLALPAYWISSTLTGGHPGHVVGHYVSRTTAVAIPSAALAVLFWLLLTRLGAPPRRALLLTALSFFGTMWFAYSTVFFPYIPGAACAMGALWLIFHPPAGRLTIPISAAIGLLLGYAMLCDLLFGFTVMGIGIVYMLRLLDQGGWFPNRAFAEMKGDRSTSREAALLLLVCGVAGALPLTLFAAYCHHIFGRFAIPYEYEADPMFREGMAQGFMGATRPSATVLYFLTLHPFRGVFYWSPIVLAALVGCALATRSYGRRMIVGWLGLWCFTSYIVFTSAYYQWWGGWTMGVRFLLPGLPFTLLGLGELARTDNLAILPKADAHRRRIWWAVLTTGVVSVALTLPISLTEPQLPQANPNQTLFNIRIGDRLEVPHFDALKVFYTGQVTIWLPDRWAGFFGSENRGWNALLILLYLAIPLGLLTWAWRQAPAKLPGPARNDFPFRTIDGTAAPPPPGMAP